MQSIARLRSLLSVSFSLAALPLVLDAAYFPPASSSAGVAEREIQKEYEATPITAEKEFPVVEIEEPVEKLDFGEEIKVFVSSIQVEGSTLFSAEELQGLVLTQLHRDLSMSDIRQICDTIRSRYVKAGYFLTRVYPPAQDIERGVLRIDVMEGKLGKVTVEGNRYYKSAFIQSYFSRMVGKPVQYDRFIKAIMLLNENSDLDAGAIFQKGEQRGLVDIILRVVDKRPVHLYANHNNYGSYTNSQHRTGGRLDYGNLLNDGDKLMATGVLGSPVKQLRFANLSYDFPISAPLGSKLNASYLYSDFEVPVMKSLGFKGRSQIGTLKGTFPVKRERRFNSDLFALFDVKVITNYAVGQTASVDNLRVLRAGFHFDLLDRWKGRNLVDAYLSQGIPSFLGASSSVSSKSSRKGAGGLFSIGNLNIERLQQLPWNSFFLINFNGQLSPSKLPLAEQIYIGGIGTVRGFPLASGLGDNGYFLNLELRMPPFGLSDRKVPFMKKSWKEFLQFVLFVDNGMTALNNDPSNETEHVHMTSAGAGCNLNLPYHFTFSFDAGFPLSEQKKSSKAITYFKITWQPF